MTSSTITVTDLFCGAGGSTTGAVQAGAEVRLAMNHWPRAIETHHTNYPGVEHVLADISQTDPRRYPSTTMLIASPECTSHSLAKGRQRKGQGQLSLWEAKAPDPSEERSRCTMWDPLRFAEYHQYPIVILENVVDAHYWRLWESWLHAWRALDYAWEIVYLNSMFVHPTPQSRDRMYFVAWKRTQRRPDLKITPLAFCSHCGQDRHAVQSWKNPTRPWGKYGRAGQYVYRCPVCLRVVTPYSYAAASAIEWARPVQRIGDRATPLKAKTLARIVSGLEKFAGHPFSIPMTRVQDRMRELTREPLPTQTATETTGLVLTLSHDGGYENLVYPAGSRPLPTQTIRDDLALVTPPFLIDHIAEYRPRPITGPLSTTVGGGNHQSLVLPPAWLMTYYHNGQLAPVSEPAPTVTTLERHALITATSEKPRVEECGFRMLEPSEIQAAMAFPREYVVTGTRREKVKQLGNAVTPPVMSLLVRRCMAALA
jgi:DNA (cytosine-5)-methyltransferase 1